MAGYVFPKRMFTPGCEPDPQKSIHYFCGRRNLLNALKDALEEDEWIELRGSRIGVFLKFYELDFRWCSRMVHYLLCNQLVCKKKYEIWSLIGVQPMRFSLNEFQEITGLNCEYNEHWTNTEVGITEEMLTFWSLLGVSPEVGPSYTTLELACQNCDGWNRQQRIWLGYLSIYASYIEYKHWTSNTRAAHCQLLLEPEALDRYPWGRFAFMLLLTSIKHSKRKLIEDRNYQLEGFAEVLNVWIFWALPRMAEVYGVPLPNAPQPPLLAYKGSRHQKKVRETMQTQTNVRNFVRKEFGAMFPAWDNDDEDAAIENIVGAMFGHRGIVPWIWSQADWPYKGLHRVSRDDDHAVVSGDVINHELGPQRVMGERNRKGKGKRKGRGAKRKLVDSLLSDDSEEAHADVSKKAKSSGDSLPQEEVSEIVETMKQQIADGFSTVFKFVNEGFTSLGDRLLSLTSDVNDIKERLKKDSRGPEDVINSNSNRTKVGGGGKGRDGGEDGEERNDKTADKSSDGDGEDGKIGEKARIENEIDGDSKGGDDESEQEDEKEAINVKKKVEKGKKGVTGVNKGKKVKGKKGAGGKDGKRNAHNGKEAEHVEKADGEPGSGKPNLQTVDVVSENIPDALNPNIVGKEEEQKVQPTVKRSERIAAGKKTGKII